MKKIITAIVLVLVASVGFYAAKVSTGTQPVAITAGSVASPVIMSPYFGFGGGLYWSSNTGMTAATTTVCAIQSPAATSTLLTSQSTVSFSVSSTSATTVTVAKATTAFATTTLIRTESIGANAQDQFIMASTTSAASTAAQALEQSNLIFAPNTWIVVSMAGGTGTFSPTGSCSPVWKQVTY